MALQITENEIANSKSGGESLVRQSNFELLRIVAMFLVLIIHANFYSINPPTNEEILGHPLSSMMRYVVESLALVCVNVYIIISGYFGIKLKPKSILNFIFMILFWKIIINIGFIIAGCSGLIDNHLGIGNFLQFCIPGYDDWFVMSYLILLFLAPILNAFVEKSSTKALWIFVAAYIVGAQIIFSWLLSAWIAYKAGFSTLSFIGLYMLGAAFRRSACGVIKHPLFIYFSVSIIVGVAMFFVRYIWADGFIYRICSLRFGAYNGLFVLIASAMLFLSFKRLKLQSRTINYIAASSFAVYLFHMHPLMRRVYAAICNYLFVNYGTFAYIGLISAFIIAVFFFSVVMDLVRRWLWNKIAGTRRFSNLCGSLAAWVKG